MRRTCSASACRRCSPTRSPARCARFARQAINQARGRGGRDAAARREGRQLRHDHGACRTERVDTREVEGWMRTCAFGPFFAQGGTISIREFLVGAFNAEMGLESLDPDLAARSGGRGRRRPRACCSTARSTRSRRRPPRATTGTGRRRRRGRDPAALVDYVEFYLLNYFKAGDRRADHADAARAARRSRAIGCANCHRPSSRIASDRRVADVETRLRPRARQLQPDVRGGVAARRPPSTTAPGLPTLKRPADQPFVVRNIFTDFKRHDLGTNFHERNYEGTLRRCSSPSPCGACDARRRTGMTGAAIPRGRHPPSRRRGAPAATPSPRSPMPKSVRDRLPPVVGPVPARRHGVDPRPWRSVRARLSPVPAREHRLRACSTTRSSLNEGGIGRNRCAIPDCARRDTSVCRAALALIESGRSRTTDGSPDELDSRSITAEGLARLLARLHADVGQAGQEYERLRRALVKFFDWRGSAGAGRVRRRDDRSAGGAEAR